MTRGLLTFSVTDAGFVYISHLYIHIKEHKRKSILLMVKFIAYIYPHPFDLVFFLPALLVPFPGFHFRVFFLMLLHYYQRPHIIIWTGFLFFVMYLFVHADLFSVQISAVLGAFSTPAAIATIIQVFPLQTATNVYLLMRYQHFRMFILAIPFKF